jgi:hypothetical protein
VNRLFFSILSSAPGLYLDSTARTHSTITMTLFL